MNDKILLDTNAYSSLLSGDTTCADYVRKAPELFLPFVVLGELYYGFFKGSKASENIATLRKFINSPRVTIIYPSDETHVIFGEIAAELSQIGKPIRQNDIWIAALCKEYNAQLLSYDKGFQHITGLQILPIVF